MLEPDQWDAVLSTITGTVYRGTERIGSAVVLNLLGVPANQQERAKAGKRIVSHMRRLGWTGPKTMRIDAGTSLTGYWRLPCSLPARVVMDDGEDMPQLGDDLPAALEAGTRLSIRKLVRILRIPTDESDGNLMRSQVTAAGIMINAQLRADEARLRAKATGDVLEKLLKLIDRKRGEAEEVVGSEISAVGGRAGPENS